MLDKTTVTKDPVSESGTKTIVKESSVAGSEQELENRVRENLRGEYARKEQAMQEKLETYESRIAEIEEKGRLSEGDRELLERLRGKKDDLDQEMNELETNPKYRAYNEKIKRSSDKAKEVAVAEAQWNMSINMGLDFVADEAEKEGIDEDTLRKELNEIVNRHGLHKDKQGNVILPHRQAKLAQKERLRSKELTKREDDLKKRELELRGGLEDGQTNVRESSLDEIKKSGDSIALAKKLGI